MRTTASIAVVAALCVAQSSTAVLADKRHTVQNDTSGTLEVGCLPSTFPFFHSTTTVGVGLPSDEISCGGSGILQVIKPGSDDPGQNSAVDGNTGQEADTDCTVATVARTVPHRCPGVQHVTVTDAEPLAEGCPRLGVGTECIDGED